MKDTVFKPQTDKVNDSDFPLLRIFKNVRRELDPLYTIFEQHLFNALVEDEGTNEFLYRVVTDYMGRLRSDGTIIPREHFDSIESDLKEEVLEMLRKKTYGHYSLAEYRKANGIVSATQTAPTIDESSSAPAPKTETRRNRRVC